MPAARRPDHAFTLPPLTCAFDALEPFIDAKTMEIHHGKHTRRTSTTSQRLASAPSWPTRASTAGREPGERAGGDPDGGPQQRRRPLEPLDVLDADEAGGGGDPKGPVADAIKAAFGSFDELKKQFNDAGLKRFASGWAWVVLGKDGKLAVTSTPNQDNPLTDGLKRSSATTSGSTPTT